MFVLLFRPTRTSDLNNHLCCVGCEGYRLQIMPDVHQFLTFNFSSFLNLTCLGSGWGQSQILKILLTDMGFVIQPFHTRGPGAHRIFLQGTWKTRCD